MNPPGKSSNFIYDTSLIIIIYIKLLGRYDVFMSVAEKLLSGMTHDLLKLSLSTRTYSPTIEMYNQVWLFCAEYNCLA